MLARIGVGLFGAGVSVDANPTIGVSRLHQTKFEHEPWAPEVIEAFDKAAPPHLRLALRLALCTRQRRSDLVKMQWRQFDGKFIEVRQQKTDELLSIPCHKVLRAALKAEVRRADAILTTRHGRASTPIHSGYFVSCL
jgi:integrase